MNLHTNQPITATPGYRPASRSAWVPIRLLAPRHRQQALEHLLALDDADRTLRFGHVADDLQIVHYVNQMDFGRDDLYGVFDRQMRLAGLAHLAFDSDEPSAEFGVSVLAHARGSGLGTRLFQHAVMHARNRGIGTLLIDVAIDNPAMLAIVRGAGAQLEHQGAQVLARLPLAADTLGSQIGALLGHGSAELDYQIKLYVRRLDRLWPTGGSAVRHAA